MTVSNLGRVSSRTQEPNTPFVGSHHADTTQQRQEVKAAAHQQHLLATAQSTTAEIREETAWALQAKHSQHTLLAKDVEDETETGARGNDPCQPIWLNSFPELQKEVKKKWC